MQDDGPGMVLSEGGPWGGSGDKDGGDKTPWTRPGAGGPSALDALIRRGRARFGGGGGGGGEPADLNLGGLWRWGVLLIVLLWVGATSTHTIGLQERGVVTRFGKYIHTLGPGLNLTLPAPIDRVTKVDVDNIHVIDIDSASDQQGENLVLTGDENIINLAYSIRWSKRDPELFLFELQDPEATIKEVAESAMREEIARVTLDQAIGAQRTQIQQQVAQRAQELLDSYHAGVVIQGVAIKQAGPPSEVMDAFKEVSAAQQNAQSYLNQARAYATQVTARAQGEATAFDAVYAQYKLAPDVTRRRMYYETMEKVLAKTDKTLVEPRNVVPYVVPPGVPRAAPEPAK